MTEDELLRGVIAELTRCMSHLGLAQGIEVSAVQGGHDRVAKGWEDISKVEG